MRVICLLITMIVSLAGFSQTQLASDIVILNDTTIFASYQIEEKTEIIDTLEKLNVVYKADYFKSMPPFRTDTIHLRSSAAFVDSMNFLPYYNEMGDSVKQVIDTYIKNNYAFIKEIIEIIPFDK